MLKKLAPAGLLAALALLLPNVALAQEAAVSHWWGPIAAAFVLGLGAFGGALAQGRTAAAACDGMARNPGAAGQIRGIAFLALVLIESLVIYTLVIAFIVQGK